MAEVFTSIMFKVSIGFTRFFPIIGVIASYVLSF
jgi:multidrug transporter EmrE-like cation transporter